MKKWLILLLISFSLIMVIIGASSLLADLNMVALHKSDSSQYNPNCLLNTCHANFLNREKSKDPRIEAIHTKMIPYIPGYNPRKGINNNICRHCHRSVNLLNKSAAALRKNVSPLICAVCHSITGPGIPLYK